jgi:WD40 repeat protein/DNA-binding XRE family transcriptional regulator
VERRRLMKKSSYREQDSAFGQQMQMLRIEIGLTQAALANLLGVSRNAVGGWEVGQSYPKAEHLKAFIALALVQHVFVAGREEEKIRTLWRAAHQKVLLDELWLQTLLSQQASPQVDVADEQTPGADRASASQALGEPQVDWGDALDVPSFYGREEELALLSRWVLQERCRVVSVLGMGGIGKSALAVTVMHYVAAQFEVVIWRSLRNAPRCSALVEAYLQVLAPQFLRNLPDTLEERLDLLMEQLRAHRVLLVLDNLETLLEEGTGTGRMRAGSEEYIRLLRRIGETAHQSCLLLTSREKPTELVSLEGSRSPVRALRLAGLDAEAGTQILADKDVVGSLQDRVRLVEVYRGNPLALKIVGQTIAELFVGEVIPFLELGEIVFGGVRELLREQFDRLSALEQSVVCWLAIVREPVTLSKLRDLLVAPEPAGKLLEAVDGLLRRSLIESGQHPDSFTLQSVVLEYVTTRLVAEAGHELEQGQLVRLIQHGLVQAQTKDYVRQVQERMLLAPVLAHLKSVALGHANIEVQVSALLDEMRTLPESAQGYGPANLVALLCMLRGNLHGLDLSRLALRGVYLQGIEMQDARLAGAILQDSVFTESFDAVTAVAVSRDGQYWAAASRLGEVRVWEWGQEASQTLHLTWQAHIASVSSLAFSPDGRQLASVSWDNMVKLWNVESGTLLWVAWQPGGINGVAFAPDGYLLASGGGDALLQLWDPQSGTNVQMLVNQGSAVYSLVWSPNGKLLASGCSDGSIWVWKLGMLEPDTRVLRLSGHTRRVTGLAFAPDGAQLASASFDGTIKLWDMESFDCLQTFSWHTDRVVQVAWSSDGCTLASCSFDHTICLWDIKESRSRAVLHEHTVLNYTLTFTSDSQTLLSGSDDGTLRVWDVNSGQCLRIIGGYAASLFDIDWSPDGRLLAGGGADTRVTLWNVALSPSPSVLRGHRWIVQGVAWSPDGRLLASGGYDSIGLWDTATGVCLQELRDPDSVDTIFQGVAWSPDGCLLACGSHLHGVQVWDMAARTRRWIGHTQPTRIRRVAWSPDGARLVGGGADGRVYIWDAGDGALLWAEQGHQGVVMSVVWSPDGMRLASVGGGKEGGELFVWKAQTGERVRALVGHPGVAFAAVWSPSGEVLISGGSDGRLRWWEVQSGECMQVREAHQGVVQALKVNPDGNILASCGDDGAIVLWDLHSGEPIQTLRRDRPYERLNITGTRGLSEAQKASLCALGAFEETNVGR